MIDIGVYQNNPAIARNSGVILTLAPLLLAIAGRLEQRKLVIAAKRPCCGYVRWGHLNMRPGIHSPRRRLG